MRCMVLVVVELVCSALKSSMAVWNRCLFVYVQAQVSICVCAGTLAAHAACCRLLHEVPATRRATTAVYN
jgi:hypothetical protein